ncbi:nitrate/nitrite transporter [Streptomyces sp. NPDC097595]|uniref:MFS transporter n=1 Tax=Streptomyces sp. NPDC097595 TaxID=3366090 RepID=UPI00382645C2
MQQPSRARRRPRVAESAPGRQPAGSLGAWAAWGIGVAVYVFAVAQRTSLGAAGLDAAERFGISASALSAFPVFQVLVYAVAQIPVGLAIDRRGPRQVLATGLVLLVAGQLGFAFSTDFATALVSRTALGCGDAMIFVSVLRIVADWFPARRAPFVAQLTGLVGTLGNLFAVTALTSMLPLLGWTVTFVVTGLPGCVALAVVLLFLRKSPDTPPPLSGGRWWARPRSGRPGRAVTAAALGTQVREAWREPGTRLGMWVHFTTSCWASPFLLLWGLPYLVDGQGLSRSTAGSLLGLVVVTGMGYSLFFGQLLSRRPGVRTPLMLAVVLTTCVLWAAVLGLAPGHTPLWLLVVLAVVLGGNGPASLIGLDYARPVNPPARAATAAGMVIMGGFTATIIALLGMGAALDLLTPSGSDGYSPAAFRVAFLIPYATTALGLVQILRLRGKAALREQAGTGSTL